MSARRCWLCGGVIRGEGRVCSECVERTEGLCSTCVARGACAADYRAALIERTEHGLPPPLYPPCRVVDGWALHVTPGLERCQRRHYGAPHLCGVVTVLLAAGDSIAHADERGAHTIRGRVESAVEAWGRELARQWGGGWKAA